MRVWDIEAFSPAMEGRAQRPHGEEKKKGGLTLIRAEKEKGKTRYKESEGVISSTYRSRRVVSLKKNYIRICEDMAAAE